MSLEKPRLEQTPLAARLRSPLSVEYCGALTIQSFDGVAAETHALLNSCGVFDLGYNSFIRVSGEDQMRWLNGMVTNSVQALELGHRNYNFVLNAQGRIQGDLYLYRRAQDLVLRTTRDQRDTLTTWFDRYIIMDDVELSSLDLAITAIGVAGPSAAALLDAIGIAAASLCANTFSQIDWNGAEVTVCRDDNPLVPEYQLWTSPSQLWPLWSVLTSAGAVSCGADAVEMARILAGIPLYGVDIRNRDLPQETNQTRALHFSKGCYLGQEIVERIRSRGNVHRSFSGFLLDGGIAASGAPLTASDKPVGELTSVARLPKGRQIALGYARRELIERGSIFHYDGGAATPVPTPFRWSLE